MATFIKLSGTRYNVDHIVNYSAHHGGGSHVVLSVMTDENAVADRVTETPEQIDAMLGVTSVRSADDAEQLVKGLLRHIDSLTCTHEETHRGGAIWTICDGCGAKWADDQGGFKPHEDPPVVVKAINYLSALRAARGE